MQTKFPIVAQLAGIVLMAGAAVAGGETAVGGSVLGAPAVGAGSTEGSVELTAPAPAGIPYYEYFNYSSYAKRSYVPGYTPHPSSLYENPRTYPAALCVIGNPYYQYAGLPGWHFSAPDGYKTGVPRGSHISKYYRGQLGITKDLRGGYPQGMRVVEDVIVPVSESVEKAGVFIQGGRTDTIVVGGDDSSVSDQFAPPPAIPAPAPSYIPENLEK